MFDDLGSYLVKLGWDVDANSLQSAFKSLNLFEGKVFSISKVSNSSLGIAAKAISTLLYEVSKATFQFASAVANADLETERFARKMWTSEESARSFKTALDALDYSSYEDIFYMTPEEYDRFMALKNFSLSLEAPEGVQETLKGIRDINGEISKLKAIVSYASQWIVYYLGIYAGEEISDLKEMFTDLNSYITNNLPGITEKIAKFLSIFTRLSRAAAYGLELLYEFFDVLYNLLPKGTVKAAAAIGSLLLLFNMGPIGIFIAGLSTLLLLLEDFYTYKQGGKSAFQSLWEQLDNMNSLNPEVVERYKESFDKLKDSVSSIATSLGDLYDKFSQLFSIQDAIDLFFENISDSAKMISDLFAGLAEILDLLVNGFESKTWNQLKEQTKGEDGKFSLAETSKNFIAKPIENIMNFQDVLTPDWLGKMQMQIGSKLFEKIDGIFETRRQNDTLLNMLQPERTSMQPAYSGAPVSITIKDSDNPRRTAEAVKNIIESNSYPRFRE